MGSVKNQKMKTKPTIKLLITLTLVYNAIIYTTFYYSILNTSTVLIASKVRSQIEKKIIPERTGYINDLSSIYELKNGVISSAFSADLSMPFGWEANKLLTNANSMNINTYVLI